jgi:hypothetical protein
MQVFEQDLPFVHLLLPLEPPASAKETANLAVM